MFHPRGPTLRELAVQALSSTERGYDLLAPKFDYTPFRTPEEILVPALSNLDMPRSIAAALDMCCGTGSRSPTSATIVSRPGRRHRFQPRNAGYRPTGDGGGPRRGANRPGLRQRAPHAIQCCVRRCGVLRRARAYSAQRARAVCRASGQSAQARRPIRLCDHADASAVVGAVLVCARLQRSYAHTESLALATVYHVLSQLSVTGAGRFIRQTWLFGGRAPWGFRRAFPPCATGHWDVGSAANSVIRRMAFFPPTSRRFGHHQGAWQNPCSCHHTTPSATLCLLRDARMSPISRVAGDAGRPPAAPAVAAVQPIVEHSRHQRIRS